MHRIVVAAALGCALAAVPAAHAQDFPTKPMRIIVPFPPGGATDTLARAISAPMSRSFGQNVIVENRPGANTLIGAELVARAPADGYTMLLIAPSFAINPSVRSKMPYDTLNDFSGVALVGASHLMISTHPSVPAKGLKDLIGLARAKPGELTFASSSIIGGQRLAAELLFRELAKIDVINVPYNGGAPAATAVMGGHTTILVSNVAETAQHVQSKRLRGIAVMSLERTEHLPDVPTVAQSGFPGFEATNWYGVMIRAATPRPVVNRVSGEIARGMQDPEIRGRLIKVGMMPTYMDPQQLDAHIRAEMQRYARVVKLLNLRMD
jgi:tripartite-type tricarboxylate transporter receptor subunit TctC